MQTKSKSRSRPTKQQRKLIKTLRKNRKQRHCLEQENYEN